MRFTCRFENRTTGEQKDLISVLDPEEVAAVERVRRTDGDDVAQVTAACFVLRSAYAELDALQWSHLSPPALVTIN
jgi:hypothetical protein